MATPEDNTAARELVARLNEKIQHVNELIEQKIEFQNKLVDSRLEGIEKTNAEKVLGFSIRLEEAVQEIRGYKEILQQQVTILDSSIKKAHTRLDELDSKGTTHANAEILAVRKELQDSMVEIEAMMKDLRALEDAKHDEELLQEAKENSPWRKFFEENGKRVLLFILLAVGLFLLKNLPDFLHILGPLGMKAAGGD